MKQNSSSSRAWPDKLFKGYSTPNIEELTEHLVPRLHMNSPHLILDGGGVEHGDVIHSDALPDDPLAAPLQLLLAVAVGQVQQTDRVLGGQVHLAREQGHR